MAAENKTGRFLGIPYDWRKPTLVRLKRSIWNPEAQRIFIPKGYGINLYEVARRLRLVRHFR